MKKWLYAGFAAFLLLSAGCNKSQEMSNPAKTTVEKEKKRVEDEADMMAEINELFTRFQLPTKLSEDMQVHAIHVTMSDDASMIADTELSNSSANLYIRAVPDVAGKSMSSKISPASTDTDWSGFETTFNKGGMEYSVTYVTAPDAGISKKQFSKMIKSFSGKHTALENIHVNDRQILSKY